MTVDIGTERQSFNLTASFRKSLGHTQRAFAYNIPSSNRRSQLSNEFPCPDLVLFYYSYFNWLIREGQRGCYE